MEANRVLIVYATWHGQTARIAEHIGMIAGERGSSADVVQVKNVRMRSQLMGYDRIIVCSGVHMQRHHRCVEKFIRHFRDILESHETALVSVSLAAAAPAGSADRKQAEKVIASLSHRTLWWPTCVITVAGALAYRKYNLLTRWMMKRISAANGGPTDTSRDYEMTDWGKLDEDIKRILPIPAQTLPVVPNDARQLRADIEEGREATRPS